VNKQLSPVVNTGGAQRLGLAAALALNEENYQVVVTYRKPRQILGELQHAGINTMQADFSSVEGILRFTEQLNSRFSSLRAIIHNASEWLPESGEHADRYVLQRMLIVHVTAPYLINQECGFSLRRHGEVQHCSDIIHMSAYVASIDSKKHIAYAGSKAAIENFTLSFASKYAPLVEVNSIAPALLMFNQTDEDAYREKAKNKSLLRIVPGEVEGVNAIRYLLESRYLTGKTIALDGGRHLAQAS